MSEPRALRGPYAPVEPQGDPGTPGSAEKPGERRTAPLIGIAGFMASGKDALADILVRDHGYEKTFMSEPLARALYALDPLIDCFFPGAAELSAELEYSAPSRYTRYQEIVDGIGYTEAKKIPEIRRLLQRLGTEVGREIIGHDTWTKVAAQRLAEIRGAGTPAVITGIRFQNELAMVQELGGVTVWIARPGITGPSAELTQHASERSVTEDDCTLTIHNRGTLDDLTGAAEWLMQRIDT